MTSYLKYKQQMAVMDADDPDIESWITVRGNHIPIKKGQTKEEAVKSFLESKGKGGKTESEHKTVQGAMGQKWTGVKLEGKYHQFNKKEDAEKFVEQAIQHGSKKEDIEVVGFEPKAETKSGGMKEKMQKLIKANGKVYGWETEGLEKFAESIEGKSVEELKDLHKEYKARVAKLGMWVDTPTKLQEQFLGEVISESEQSSAKNDTYNYKKGEEVEFYTDVMHDDLAKGKIVGFERSMASHGHKAENQYVIEMPDGSTRTVNEKQIDWAKARKEDKQEPKKSGKNEINKDKLKSILARSNIGNGRAFEMGKEEVRKEVNGELPYWNKKDDKYTFEPAVGWGDENEYEIHKEGDKYVAYFYWGEEKLGEHKDLESAANEIEEHFYKHYLREPDSMFNKEGSEFEGWEGNKLDEMVASTIKEASGKKDE